MSPSQDNRPPERRSFEPSRSIDVNDPEELARFAERFNADPEDIRAAVEVVGTNSTAVEIYLDAPPVEPTSLAPPRPTLTP